MSKKSVFFTDVDGTLIHSDFVLRDDVIEAAAAYRQAGNSLILCTGRSVQAVTPYLEKLGITEPAIIYNGGAIYSAQEKKILWKQVIDRSVLDYVQYVYDHHPEICIIVFTEKDIYRLHSNWTLENKGIPQEHGIVITDISKIQGEILKISLIADHHAELERCRQLDIWDGWKLEYSGRHFLEVVSQNTGKGIAMKKLLDEYDFPGEVIYAAGNSMNDIGMMREADYAFAPKDSGEDVLAVCDHVIDTAVAGGMKEALNYAERHCREHFG